MKRDVKFSLDLFNKVKSDKAFNGRVKNLLGNSVEILKTDLNRKDKKCILGVVTNKDGIQESMMFFSDGSCSEKGKTMYDLLIEIEDFIPTSGSFLKFKRKDGLLGTFICIVDRVESRNDGDYYLFVKCGAYITEDGKFTAGGPRFHLNNCPGDTSFRHLVSDINPETIEELTDQEKVLLLDSLKVYNMEWDERSGNLIDNNKFEIGTKVLGYDGSGHWRLDFFSHFDSRGYFVCTGRTYKDVVVLTENSKKLVKNV